MKILNCCTILFAIALMFCATHLQAQVYSNVLVEVNTIGELTALNVSAPFVWCRANNTLYFFDANLNTFTPYPANTVTSVNSLTGAVTLTTANIADSTNKRYVTDAQQTTLAGLGTMSTQNANNVNITGGSALFDNGLAQKVPLTSFKLNYFVPSSSVTADRTLTINPNDANRLLSLSGDLTVSGTATISGTNTGDQNLSGLMVKANNLSDLTNVATAKTNLSLVKGDVGLANVDNTSDVNKPVSTAQQTALNLKVNLTQPYGYMIDLQGLTSSPVDAQTIFFGNIPRAPTTTAANSQIFIRKAGTIKVAEIYCFSGTAGTNEAWSISIRLNNTTDTLIQTVSSSSATRTFTNSALSIAVAAGDYIEIKSVNPTWVTNPLTTVFGGYIYIE